MQLRPALMAHFPDCNPARLPGGFDRVGDIAVVSLVPELVPCEREIGALILDLHKTIRVVARRDGSYGGEFRTLPLRVIGGEERLTTVHRENGVVLHLDLARVYFSVRLAHERARIGALIQPGERVAVLCSGVGPFPLIIGRHSRAGSVIGIEKNPVAHEYALRNLRANRAIRTVRFFEGDAGQVLSRQGGLFDRILVVLPHGGEALLPVALPALRPGGTLHFYAMQAKGCASDAVATVETACRDAGYRPRSLRVTVCGHCGPTVHRICLDTVIAAE